MPELAALRFDNELAAQLVERPALGTRLYWLGQAGFVIEIAGYRLVIDPYLSDSLAEKYRGREFSHERLMPSPVTVAELGHVDLVLSTHHHTDHMDAATLQPLFATRPGLRLIAPIASADEARRRSGLGDDRLLLVDAGDRIEPLVGITIATTRAAHETLQLDEFGRHRFLGFIIEADGVCIWHSGDCVPFDGLVDDISRFRPDLALLPVNGRNATLAARGIPGNFMLGEAIDIAGAVGAKAMLAHHHGMFAFNTADPNEIDQAAARAPLTVMRAETRVAYTIASN